MNDVYPRVFVFTAKGGIITFDFESGKVVLKLDKGYEFPAPMNLHNFCVVLGGILYGKNVGRKQVFFAGKPGERKVIELRGILYERKKEEEEEENQPDNGQTVRMPRALLTFIDEPGSFKKTFMLNIYNVYALWELFRAQDKVVSVDDLVFERREGNVFIQGVPLPFQKAKSVFYALDRYLREGYLPGINQEWEYGKLMLWRTKKRIDFFKKNGETLIPSGVIRVNPDNAFRLMSVL